MSKEMSVVLVEDIGDMEMRKTEDDEIPWADFRVISIFLLFIIFVELIIIYDRYSKGEYDWMISRS